MNNQDVQKIFSDEIEIMSGEELGNLVIWFNRTQFETILALFNHDKDKLKDLEKIVSIPIEIDIDSDKLDILRYYLGKE
ncbi:hypothetical protein BKK51_00670 [Rodentibacter trehalosifermentans]|uniref:Uncharacterized protein n=1 Tax=Rodentibacter trehalosifermentans TaxID=1908263 RepID=A0A1V3IQN3_9PAST|nr:hypothetical protein [Rodentibacter trehalosifermentans]OOF44493.1 hypothetical protein BKK52_13075 [Rodentibacter trehalosifermentans]OOF47209.1 hypothetical protein BKK51_00670 [Rodentibacter trehalosifermentans]